MKLKIGAIVIRCYEYKKMISFWQEALGYVPLQPPGDEFAILTDPGGTGPDVSLDMICEKRTGKRSHIHLDLFAEDQKSEVERLVSIGAKLYPWRYEPNNNFIVLEDPDGNLFCVMQL